jgi:hypothetical protein
VIGFPLVHHSTPSYQASNPSPQLISTGMILIRCERSYDPDHMI